MAGAARRSGIPSASRTGFGSPAARTYRGPMRVRCLSRPPWHTASARPSGCRRTRPPAAARPQLSRTAAAPPGRSRRGRRRSLAHQLPEGRCDLRVLGRQSLADIAELLDHLDHQPVGDPLTVGETAPRDHPCVETLKELGREPPGNRRGRPTRRTQSCAHQSPKPSLCACSSWVPFRATTLGLPYYFYGPGDTVMQALGIAPDDSPPKQPESRRAQSLAVSGSSGARSRQDDADHQVGLPENELPAIATVDWQRVRAGADHRRTRIRRWDGLPSRSASRTSCKRAQTACSRSSTQPRKRPTGNHAWPPRTCPTRPS